MFPFQGNSDFRQITQYIRLSRILLVPWRQKAVEQRVLSKLHHPHSSLLARRAVILSIYMIKWHPCPIAASGRSFVL